VGNNCIGANVNRQLVSKFHVLSSGDQIEILTSKKQEPSEEWVKHAKTTRARAKIREALKEKKRVHSEEGRNKILEVLDQLNVDSSNVNLGNLQKLLKYSSALDMYYDAFLGKLSLREIKQAIPETEKSWISRINPFSKSEKIDLSETLKKNTTSKSALENLVSLNKKSTIEFDPSNFSVATCCNPIPGDDVTGFVQPGGSIVIHRTSCSEARNQMSKYGNNIVKTKWNSSGSISCLTTLKVKGFDRQGLLVEVSQIISNEMNINMKSVQFDTDSGIFEGEIIVYVSSTDHLKSLISRLAKVDGIQQVFRLQSNNDELLMSL
jgi:GTP pyrophosphokinase